MSQTSRSQMAWTVLRLTLAGLIAAHGWARFLGGGVEPFGSWLTSQGVPFGPLIAGAVTVIEIVGTPLLAWGRYLVFPLAVLYSAIYAVGIAMVHAPARAGSSWVPDGTGPSTACC